LRCQISDEGIIHPSGYNRDAIFQESSEERAERIQTANEAFRANNQRRLERVRELRHINPELYATREAAIAFSEAKLKPIPSQRDVVPSTPFQGIITADFGAIERKVISSLADEAADIEQMLFALAESQRNPNQLPLQ
jgi:hypothetical protein